MVSYIESIFHFFFGENFPELRQILLFFPLLLIYTIGALELAEQCRQRWNWKVGYTRKLFHFLIFGMAGGMQYWQGIGGVFILGWVVSLVIIYLLIKKDNSRYYSLLARPQDYPYASRYIVYPYVATFLGGVISNFLFVPVAAVAGYLVVGLGDAIGEPVGTKWGKTRYPVFNWGSKVKSYRSVEGSVAVFLVCLLAFALPLYFYGYPITWYKIIIAALVAAIIEGISPHGWDNLVSQIAGAILTLYFLI